MTSKLDRFYIRSEAQVTVIGHSIEHEKKMGSYFLRNYMKKGGSAFKGQKVDTTPPESDFRYWFPMMGVNRQPPRIYLREGGHPHSKDPIFQRSKGHMEFKDWIQYKVESASLGETSARVLSENRSNNDNDVAGRAWNELSEKLAKKFRELHFTDANLRHRINRVHREIKLFDEHQSDGRQKDDKFVLQICRMAIKSVIQNTKFTESREAYCSSQKCLKNLIDPVEDKVNEAIKKINKLEQKTLQNVKIGNKTALEIRGYLLKNGFGITTNNLKDLSPESATKNSCRRLSINLLDILMDEGFLRYTRMTSDEAKKEFQTVIQKPNKFVLEKKFWRYLNDDPNHPIFRVLVKEEDRWMYCPPESHKYVEGLMDILEERGSLDLEVGHWFADRIKSEFVKGGYLNRRKQKIVIGGEEIYDRFDTPRCDLSESITDALNILQDTQWEINLDILQRFCDIRLMEKDDNSCPECGSIARTKVNRETVCLSCGAVLVESQEDYVRYDFDGDWSQKKNRIASITVKPGFEKLIFGEAPDKSDSNFQISNQDYQQREKERKRSLDWSRRIIDLNANVFWHAWGCDFRGRLYPRSTHLSPHGDDFDRGMIRFKQYKPLGERGIFWLRVHVHNLMEGTKFEKNPDSPLNGAPEKGRTFDERSKWVEDNEDALVIIADNFEDYIYELKLDERRPKEDSIQRISALLEFSRVSKEYKEKKNWDNISSGLPVNLDGSSNGYQHLSAVLGDESLAEATNVYPTESPEDFYQKIADSAKNHSEELRSWLQNNFDSTITEDIIHCVLDRKMTKIPTMTMIYGAKQTIYTYMTENNSRALSYGKIRELSQKKLNERDKIPQSITQWYNNNPEPIEDNEQRKKWWKKFKSKVKSEHKRIKKGLEKKARDYYNLLNGVWFVPVFSKKSPLHDRLIKNQKHKQVKKFFVNNKKSHFEFAKLVDRTIHAAIHRLTSNGLDNLSEPLSDLSSIIQENNFLYPAISWKFDDDFVVHNYDIKGNSRDKNAVNQSNSRYTSISPHWYITTKKTEENNYSSPSPRLSRIANRLYRIISEIPHLDSNQKDIFEKFEKDIMKSPSKNFDKKELAELFNQFSDGSNDFSEIEKLLFNRPTYSLIEYPKSESERISYSGMKSAIFANFIHSIDAFHMRATITHLNNEIEDLSFWAIHDAFGTHACDIDKLMESVSEEFANIHRGKNLQYWVKNMVRNTDHLNINLCKASLDKAKENKTVLDSEKLRKSTYLIA